MIDESAEPNGCYCKDLMTAAVEEIEVQYGCGREEAKLIYEDEQREQLHYCDWCLANMEEREVIG